MEKIDKIKFSAQNNPEFFAELKEKVSKYFESRNITRYGNFNLVLKTIVLLSLYIGPYILMVSGLINTFWAMFASWAVMGIGMAGIGMSVMHDANHKSYSKNQKVNKWLGKSIYILGGFPPNWQHQHNTLHHTYTNIDGRDEDIDPGSVLRFSPHKPLLKAHKYQHIYAWFLYCLMTLTWATDKDFVQLKRYKDSGARISKRSYSFLFVDLILTKILYYIVLIVIPAILMPFAWYWIIVGFLTMQFICGFLLTIIFQTAHVVPTAEYPLPDKNGIMDNHWAVHQLHTTADFSPNNKILSWYIGGLNFQIEHHLFPGISHVHYPKLSKFVKETAEKYNLPYNVTPKFLRAVIEHGKMLRTLGRLKPIPA